MKYRINNYDINGEIQSELMTEMERKKNAINFVRDSMATLRWYIWEEIYNDNKRITEDEFQTYIRRTIVEYSKIDCDLEDSFILKLYDDENDVFGSIEKKLILTKDNSFLLRGQSHRYR